MLDFLSFYLKIHRHLYLHLAAYFIYGHEPRHWWETLLALVAQSGFAISLGVVFTYLLAWVGLQNHLLKGWSFAVMSWFLVYAVAGLAHVPAGQSWSTAISHFTTSSVFGLVLASEARHRLSREA